MDQTPHPRRPAHGEVIRITDWFDLVLAFNPGAFSFLADQAGWQRWFFVALAR